MSGEVLMKDIQRKLNGLLINIEKVIFGKRPVIELAVISLMCRGHLLIEDVPGVGKTMLAMAISKSLDLGFKRVQFTPDLLPSDITGVSIFNQKTSEFEFKPGPVFTNILLADEINRATPRTQSSLLEAMEERHVTVDGRTHPLPEVFMVIATQNPIELHGTYPLPEAQLDRFFMRISIGYPTNDKEVEVMDSQRQAHPINSISAILTAKDLMTIQDAVTNVYIDSSIMEYIVRIMEATRRHDDLALGASPRGSLSLMRASQAMALLRGKEFVDPYTVKSLSGPVLNHRIILKPESRLKGLTEEKVIEDVLRTVAPPVSD
jgi:MoxR-like ATPase